MRFSLEGSWYKPRTEVENPPAKGGTSFKFPVQVFVPVSRSQLDQGASKEDLTVEWLCPNFPKLGMVDPGTGAGDDRWKGIEGEDEEMAFHRSRGCSATRTRLQEPAGVLDRDPAANRECHLLQRQSLNFFPPLSSLALTLCRCSLKTAGLQPNQNKIPLNTSVEESIDPTLLNLGKGSDIIIRMLDKNKIFFLMKNTN